MKKLLLCSDKYYARAVPIFVKGAKKRAEAGFWGARRLHARLKLRKICLLRRKRVCRNCTNGKFFTLEARIFVSCWYEIVPV